MDNSPMQRIASIISAILLVLLLLLPVCSWVWGAMGFAVQNMICAEGFRWICMHARELLLPQWLAYAFAFFIGLGCIQFSGIISALQRRRTVNEKLGIICATSVFLILFSPVVVPIFKVSSALRGVTGTLYPSPWFAGLPFALSIIIFFSMVSYSLFAHKKRPYHVVADLLSAGISHYAIWLVNLSMINLLMGMINYIF